MTQAILWAVAFGAWVLFFVYMAVRQTKARHRYRLQCPRCNIAVTQQNMPCPNCNSFQMVRKAAGAYFECHNKHCRKKYDPYCPQCNADLNSPEWV